MASQFGGWKDYLDVAMLGVTTIALIFAGLSLRQQAKASDISSYFSLMERFSVSWRRFKDEPDLERKNFEFLELVNLFESACHLFNAGSFSRATEDMLQEYLTEMLPAFFENEYTKDAIEASLSGPNTFFHIRRFARKFSLAGVPQQ